MPSSAKIQPSDIEASISSSDHDHHHGSVKLIKPDTVFESIGSFGRFQKLQFFLICIPIVFVQMHVLSWTFIYEPARKLCPPVLKNLNLNDTEECIEHAYSASDRWDMRGPNSWIKPTVQSLYFIGQMIGSFMCGVLADKHGRKKVLFFCLMLQVTCASGLVFAPYWWLYAILKLGTGFSQPGIYGVAVVLGIELVGKKYRSIISVIANVFSALGSVILAGLAYLLVDYRFLHAAIAIPSLIFITYWWTIYESARWLVSKEEYEQADRVLLVAAKMNKTTIPENWVENIERPEYGTKKIGGGDHFGLIDLVRTPQMRRRTLANFLMWPATTMVYYGLSMKSDVSGGNLFVTFITSALIEIPAVVVVFLLIDRIGRKPLFSGSILLSGLILLLSWLLADYISSAVAVSFLLIAKCSISIAYTTMYTYTSELFPTVIRNSAVGCCSTMARFGAIMASVIAYYLVDEFGTVVMILPFTVISILAAVASFLLLPETMDKPLPDSISQVEGTMI